MDRQVLLRRERIAERRFDLGEILKGITDAHQTFQSKYLEFRKQFEKKYGYIQDYGEASLDGKAGKKVEDQDRAQCVEMKKEAEGLVAKYKSCLGEYETALKNAGRQDALTSINDRIGRLDAPLKWLNDKLK